MTQTGTVREQVSVCKACRRPFKRTRKQNAFIHAEIFPKLAKAMGESVSRTKLILMGEFWGYEPCERTGHMLPVKAHTSEMTVAECNTFIDWVVPWAAQEYGVEIILPDEWKAA